MSLFHKGHHNIIAAQIQKFFPLIDLREEDRNRNKLIRNVLTNLALSMARRFKEDNPQFNPYKFLDACSPDIDVYPLRELWEDGSHKR